MKKRLIISLAVSSLLFGCSNQSIVTETETDPSYVIEQEMTISFVYGERTGIYTGQIDKGLPHGEGVFKSKNLQDEVWVYRGEWNNGHMDGIGITLHGDDEIKAGVYENDDITQGVIYINNHSVALGDFIRDSQGELTSTYGFLISDEYNNDSEQTSVTIEENASFTEDITAVEDTAVNDSEEFLNKIWEVTEDCISNGESIDDIQLINKDLIIYVSLIDDEYPIGLTHQDIAIIRTGSITDPILDLKEYYDIWDSITVDFGSIGFSKNTKSNIIGDEYPYFTNKTLQKN